MSELSEFEVYADEPSIIYEFSMEDCPAGVLCDDLGEGCASWLWQEYPKCSFFFELDCCVLFLDPGHGLSEAQIRLIQSKAAAFVRGLRYGAEIARRPKGPLREG